MQRSLRQKRSTGSRRLSSQTHPSIFVRRAAADDSILYNIIRSRSTGWDADAVNTIGNAMEKLLDRFQPRLN